MVLRWKKCITEWKNKLSELNYKNQVKAINTKVIPVAAYPTNISKFTQSELTELDQVIKKEFQHARTTSKHWTILHEKKRLGGRFKSLKEVYEETRLGGGVICLCQIKGGSRKLGNEKKRKTTNSIKNKIILIMQIKDKTVQFEGEDMKLEGKKLEKELKLTWTQVKDCLKKGSEEK